MPVLHILKGANQGQRVPLEGDRVTLGRNRDCTVVIDFPAVSRIHANIQRIDGKYWIEDGDGQGNRSRNGTFVNNQAVEKLTPLQDQDRIKICDFLCTYRDEEETDEGQLGSSVVEATLGRLSSSEVLQAQPAEKITALLDISAHLSKTLELDALLPRIADSLFQIFKQADRCFLIQCEPPHDPAGKLVPKLIKTRRLGGESNARFSRTIAKQCLATGQSVLSEDAASDSRFGLAQSIADFRIRSVMVAPLCSPEGKAFGAIQLDTQDRTKKFTPDDLKLLIGVANQAAVSLENAQLHKSLLSQERHRRDLEVAREVQRSFLPQSLPTLPGYQFSAHYEPAQEIGGDYYDFIPLPSGKLAVLLGDVAGKGVSAALLMAKLSSEARYCMLSCANPAEAISKLNDSLLRAGLLDKFVTLGTVILDPARHKVTVVNAGHLMPLRYTPGAREVSEAVDSEVSGLPLGVMESYQYTSAEIDIKPGESILLYTDGIPDAWNTEKKRFEEMVGVQEALHPKGSGAIPFLLPSAVSDRLLKAVKQHSAGATQFDDIALVCFGRIS